MSSGGHLDWSDGVQTFLVAESLVIKHSAKLHPDLPSASLVYGNDRLTQDKQLNIREPYYTNRSLLLVFISALFYYVATVLSISPIFLVAFFVNSLIIALISLVVFYFSFEIYRSKKIALVLGLIFTVCSFILPYNTTLFPQPIQALCVISSAYFLYKSQNFNDSFISSYNRKQGNNSNNTKSICQRKGAYFAVLGGIFLGLSVFAHPASIIVIPGFVVYYAFSVKYSKKKKIRYLLVSLAIILVLVGLSNYIRYGSFTEFGYYRYASWSWANRGWIGLVGLWSSPGAGLIFFFPPVILLPIAFRYMYTENKRLFFLILYVIAVNWLYFGTLSYLEPISWSGGLVWGPRYLIPVLPFITIALGTLLTHLRNKKQKLLLFRVSTVISLFVIGFVINLLGTIVWIYYFHLYSWEKEQIWRHWANTKPWDPETWNPRYSPIVLDLKILADSYLSDIQLERYNGTSYHFVTYGLVPCSYDLYIFCKFGIIPIMILSALAVLLAYIIINDRRTAFLSP
ncbi:MAG TPA: hypothetical protein VKA95_01560 [Nitrososphaeraceae archaeon]|nr:hypothetical protein [Nitrososphaeraceae archaeon]